MCRFEVLVLKQIIHNRCTIVQIIQSAISIFRVRLIYILYFTVNLC